MSGIILDGNKETAKTLNQLAREQMKAKLLSDILIDLNICEIEGWDKKEYIEDLLQTIKEMKK